MYPRCSLRLLLDSEIMLTQEDLDLLSFSTLASQIPHQKPSTVGLPLKAVYRDSVVGIRYLHRTSTINNSTV